MAIVTACALTAAIGLGFVLWEQWETHRTTRERLRRRTAEPVFARVPNTRHRLDVRGRRRAA
jgi:hypothetical protein